jgi:hypothetical protein
MEGRVSEANKEKRSNFDLIGLAAFLFLSLRRRSA